MRVLPGLALAASLLLGACQNPDGTLNVPASLALGAGAALGVAALASANDNSHRHRGYDRRSYGYSRPYYGRDYGYNRGYRRW
ncbi:hypothetical protein [Falsiroseomonas sp.]|uniref:hypothetical protein n=1 Tax=Falsiroseomonas sp. TaxID=2870721 RepID=UPI003F720168